MKITGTKNSEENLSIVGNGDGEVEEAWFFKDLLCPVTNKSLFPVRDNFGKILRFETQDSTSSYPVKEGIAYLVSPNIDYFKYLKTEK